MMVINNRGPRKTGYEDWTEEEIEVLKKYYKTTSCRALSQVLGRSTGSIISKAYKLNLQKTKRIENIAQSC